MTSDDIARRVAEARFTPVRMQEGYDMSQVDAFLDRVVAAAADQGAVDELVAGARFATVRVREGYDVGQVDDFLASLTAGGRGPVPAQERPAYDGGIRETRSWWSRLFGSGGR